MEKINCPFCGKDYSHNRNLLQNHINNICEKNPSNNYTEAPQFFEKGKKYLKKQKIKYICNTCRKIRICFFENFKEDYLKKCTYCQSTQNSNKTKIEKYGSIENYNRIHRQNLEKRLAEKYGSLEEGYKYIQKQKENAVQEKYGVPNVSKLDFVNNKRKETLSKEEKKQQIKDSLKKTCETRYGAPSYFETKTFREKAIATWTKKYGANDLIIDNPFKAPSIIEKIKVKSKQTFFQKYGVEYYSQSIDAQKHHKAKFKFKNIFFDSKPELAFYIYCKDQGLDIKRETKSFNYNFKGKEYFYFQDFEIEGKFYEIKGNHFLTKEGKWQNPFDHSLDEKYENKHRCALKNNVIILYENEYQKYINYVEEKYGKDYLNQFKYN